MKADVHLVWQVDGEELVPIGLAPVPRHQAVLHLAVAAAVLVRGVQTPAARMDDPALVRDDPVPEHGGAHGRVLGQGEGVGRPPEHRGVVVEVGDLDDDGDGPSASSSQHRASHLG